MSAMVKIFAPQAYSINAAVTVFNVTKAELLARIASAELPTLKQERVTLISEEVLQAKYAPRPAPLRPGWR